MSTCDDHCLAFASVHDFFGFLDPCKYFLQACLCTCGYLSNPGTFVSTSEDVCACGSVHCLSLGGVHWSEKC